MRCLHRDGKRVLTGCGDDLARVWDVATGRLVGLPVAHPTWFGRVAFVPTASGS